MRYTIKKIGYLIFVIIFISVSFTTPIQVHAQGPTPFANCRLGAGSITSSLTGYDIAQLNMGLHLNWTVQNPPPAGLPAGVEHIQVVRVHQQKVGDWNSAYVVPYTYTVSPPLTQIATIANALPGSLWLIGNEIDRRDHSTGGQDEMLAELYVTAFHEIRNTIKTADGTARIGIAGIIQATPLRLEYLSLIWDEYFNKYGYSMGDDIDVWNVHGFILREIRNDWGADTPPGFGDANGFLNPSSVSTAVAAHHDIDAFQKLIQGGSVTYQSKNYNLEGFREWMASHGERNKPLLVSEYGILYGNPYINHDQISNFLTSSFI